VQPEIHEIWTHPANKDSLTEIRTWSVRQIYQALDWLDAHDEAEAKRIKK
jgi:hypothetical protein